MFKRVENKETNIFFMKYHNQVYRSIINSCMLDDWNYEAMRDHKWISVTRQLCKQNKESNTLFLSCFLL